MCGGGRFFKRPYPNPHPRSLWYDVFIGRSGMAFPKNKHSLEINFIMAKNPTIKFPRIEAGFYSVTQDGELVGYIMREVTDDKETNWYIFDNATPEMDMAMLHPEDAIDAPDSLFREAKENAKAYFLNRPVEVQVEAPMAPIEEAQWTEEDEDEDVIEDNNLFVSDDGEFELFEDELEFDTVEAEDLVLA